MLELDSTAFLSPATALYALTAAILNLDLKYVFELDTFINRSYGGQLQFLTILGVVFSYITVTIGLMGHIMDSQSLIATKNRFLLIAAPVEVLISVLYGSIFLYDKKLLVPDNIDAVLPPLVDFGLHGAPSILLLVDYFVFTSNWIIHPAATFVLYSSLGVGYWFWTQKTYAMNGFYPYPLLEIVTTPQRIGIFAVSIIILFSIYLTLRKIHMAIHGKKLPVPIQEKAK
ncbi:FAR-17a/AIG1-like protein [Myxozyma melibiosi]|uniref:FAR-17a/AIG1-like protein n=1 Tax=Myxozyma melibiosi TaxID=54550 RepID=A0ABR1F458_9ASCO